MKTITPYLALCRVPISLLVACSAITGQVVASPSITSDVLVASAGVFLLACGASALNQVQERDIDALMERTRRRPLPAGMLSPLNALIASFTALLAGLLLLGRSGRLPFIIGVLAVLWYNGLYTWLKRRTTFAAVDGGPVGMAAPAIGWAAGGGSISDPRLAVLCLLFFLWQVPHFWLLLLRSGDDYERAGLPSLTKVFPREILSGITVLWLIAAASASMLLPLFGMVRTPLLYGLLVLSVLLSSAGTSGLLRKPSFPRAAFPLINLFLAALMVLISADALLVR
jgi:protoheme IX farnesyltransferase